MHRTLPNSTFVGGKVKKFCSSWSFLWLTFSWGRGKKAGGNQTTELRWNSAASNPMFYEKIWFFELRWECMCTWVSCRCVIGVENLRLIRLLFHSFRNILFSKFSPSMKYQLLENVVIIKEILQLFMINFSISDLQFTRMWTNVSIVLNPRWFLTPAPWVWVSPQDQASKDDDWLGRSTGEEKSPHPFFSALGKLPVGKHLRTSCGNFLFDFHAQGGWEWKSGHNVGRYKLELQFWHSNYLRKQWRKNHHGEKSQHRGARKAIFNKLGEKLMPSQIAEFQSRKAC